MAKALFLAVVFISNIIQALTGFGGTMLAMPVSILLIGVREAKGILNIIGLSTCLWLTLRNYQYINVKECIKITLLMFAGMAVGIVLFKIIPIAFLLKIYAVLIIVLALKKLLIKKAIFVSNWLLLPVILGAGIIHGMFVSGGALLVVYAAAVFKCTAYAELAVFQASI